MGRVPVLIVGAGPCGVGLAIELGWRGVECLNTYLYLTGFNRHEPGRFEHPGNGQPGARPDFSPEGPIWSPK